MSSRSDQESPHYLLGHSERELDRLDLQGEIYRDITVRALREGGIEPGMRVLDLGCGTGDLSLTVAEIVGPDGTVVGIDRSSDGFALARSKARGRGIANVDFVQSEILSYEGPTPYDGLVGRWVLMHQPDPTAALHAATRSLRAGGTVVMIDTHIEMLALGDHSEPHSPIYDRIVKWKTEVVRGAGAHTRTGPQLRRIFLDAGLPDPAVRMEASLEGGPDSAYYRYVAESARNRTTAHC